MTNTTTNFPTTIIRFTLVNKRTKTTVPCWLEAVRFADGPGMKVTKMTTTRDRSKAARFSIAKAYEIAIQFSQFPASLERANGTELVQETIDLRAEQATRRANTQRIRAEFEAGSCREAAQIAAIVNRVWR